MLTREIARQLTVFPSRHLKPDGTTGFLHEFTSIEDDAEKILGKTDAWLNLDGLTELSDAAAKGLSTHKVSSFASSGVVQQMGSRSLENGAF